METFWSFWLRFRRAYDSAYNSDFWFPPGHKRSYDSAYASDSDSVASENQPLETEVYFNGFKRSWFVICDWWISIRFVSFCVSRFVAWDRNDD